jgi:hypothetical protein
MAPIGSLTRERIVVDGVEWNSKVVRTGGPSGLLHDEWALSVRFACEMPFRAAGFLDSDGVRLYACDWARHPERVAELSVHFRPYDWTRSDDVQVMAGGIRAVFESAALKADPVAATSVDVAVALRAIPVIPLPS